MSDPALRFYAAKFFPHLLPEHGFLVVKKLWETHRATVKLATELAMAS